MPDSESQLASIELRKLNFEIEKHSRERWWKEDELINQRITWLLTTQGALSGVYGFLKYRIAELKFGMQVSVVTAKTDDYVHTINSLSDGIMLIGLISAVVSLVGISAAMRAQKSLRDQYGTHLGVSENTTRLGHFDATGSPVLCGVAWCAAFVIFQAGSDRPPPDESAAKTDAPTLIRPH